MLMDAQLIDDPEHGMMLTKMDIQIDKLTSLITVLLDTSKVQAGKLIFNKKPFKIRELINEVTEEIRPAIRDQQLIFIADCNPTIIADRDRIGQVLTNLIINATKYATQSKKIIVGLKQKSEKVVCSVEDFGNGIAAVELNKIFERFYRVLGNNLHTYPGLGLGLYISRGIIESHNGTIWVDSEVGKGSTFYFELPVAEQ
jgi:signal transduction histidine kinase